MNSINKLEVEQQAVNNIIDAIRGCLIGGAAGDALGYPIEFLGEEEIFTRYTKEGIMAHVPAWNTGKTRISDDTQMTLFTANGLLNAETKLKRCELGVNPTACVADAYLDWVRTQNMSYEKFIQWKYEDDTNHVYTWLSYVPELYQRRAPGTTCINELSIRGKHIKNLKACNASKGCGGVMRVAPVGLWKNNEDIKTLDRLGADIAEITHAHSLGYMTAAVMVHIINRIVFPISKRLPLKEIVAEAVDTVAELYEGDIHLQELTSMIKLSMKLSENDDSDLENIHRIGGGWVAEETLGIAIYCALRHQDDFSKGIIAAVNHDGDSDSTGAVTGNILGAWAGYKGIDEKWKKDLELADVILEMADDICKGCQMVEYEECSGPDWIRKYVSCKWKE